MRDMTLVILAAGMGSRFGGLKQVAPMGPNGEFIIDYSIYDAIKAGFNKVVFIIKEENYDLFKSTIGSRIESHINVKYCFQKNDNIPEGYKLPDRRVKPLGTAHAILCAKDIVKEPFVIINADDFYGTDAFMVAANYLKDMEDSIPEKYGMVGYKVVNTITENGSVKRGVCQSVNGYLTNLIESSVERSGSDIIATPLDGREQFKVSEDTLVSMNMFLFNPSIFKYIDKLFPIFLQDNTENMEKCEYLIPDVVFDAIKNNFASVKVLKTDATWYGVTYKEDTKSVQDALKKMHDEEVYTKTLW